LIKCKKYTFSVFIYLKREGGGRKKKRKAKGRKVKVKEFGWKREMNG